MTPPTTRKPGSPPLRPASRRTRLSVPMPTAAHACPQVHRLLTSYNHNVWQRSASASQRRAWAPTTGAVYPLYPVCVVAVVVQQAGAGTEELIAAGSRSQRRRDLQRQRSAVAVRAARSQISSPAPNREQSKTAAKPSRQCLSEHLSRCCRYAEVRAGRGCFRWLGRWPGRVVRHKTAPSERGWSLHRRGGRASWKVRHGQRRRSGLRTTRKASLPGLPGWGTRPAAVRPSATCSGICRGGWPCGAWRCLS